MGLLKQYIKKKSDKYKSAGKYFDKLIEHHHSGKDYIPQFEGISDKDIKKDLYKLWFLNAAPEISPDTKGLRIPGHDFDKNILHLNMPGYDYTKVGYGDDWRTQIYDEPGENIFRHFVEELAHAKQERAVRSPFVKWMKPKMEFDWKEGTTSDHSEFVDEEWSTSAGLGMLNAASLMGHRYPNTLLETALTKNPISKFNLLRYLTHKTLGYAPWSTGFNSQDIQAKAIQNEAVLHKNPETGKWDLNPYNVPTMVEGMAHGDQRTKGTESMGEGGISEMLMNQWKYISDADKKKNLLSKAISNIGLLGLDTKNQIEVNRRMKDLLTKHFEIMNRDEREMSSADYFENLRRGNVNYIRQGHRENKVPPIY